MTAKADYPELDQLIGTYFNQDFDLWGETIEEVVRSYVQGTSAEQRDLLRSEIDRFVAESATELDAVFSQKYGFDLDPTPWGHTALSFLREVQRLLERRSPA
jgi:hypothetical protein